MMAMYNPYRVRATLLRVNEKELIKVVASRLDDTRHVLVSERLLAG